VPEFTGRRPEARRREFWGLGGAAGSRWIADGGNSRERNLGSKAHQAFRGKSPRTTEKSIQGGRWPCAVLQVLATRQARPPPARGWPGSARFAWPTGLGFFFVLRRRSPDAGETAPQRIPGPRWTWKIRSVGFREQVGQQRDHCEAPDVNAAPQALYALPATTPRREGDDGELGKTHRLRAAGTEVKAVGLPRSFPFLWRGRPGPPRGPDRRGGGGESEGGELLRVGSHDQFWRGSVSSVAMGLRARASESRGPMRRPE